MATALYRRYRPESFAEVIGQDHVTTPLMRALRAGRVGHAYLFSGPRGCGKTTSARILARCLNCAEGPTDTPCGSCDSCRDLARGGPGSLDVVEIDAASHGGVDDARELRERATFAPARDRFKVFIIDEAHMVTSAGFNALLKLVEEPPEHVKFVFATTEPDKVIGTIRSRTHHYPFRLIPPQVLTPYLQEVCEAESVPVGDGVLPLVVRAGGGSARDTLSVLDQLMAGAAEEGLDQATAIALLGFTDTALLDGAVEAIAAADAGALYQVTEQVLATGHEPRRFVEDLLERLRDLIVLAAVPDRAQDLLPQIPADDLERMRHQSGLFTPADLSRCGDLVHETLSTMSGATSPRLHLELLAARLVLRGQALAPAAGAPAAGPAGGAQRAAGGGAPQGGAPAQAGDGGGREMARRIAAERAEAARRARGGPGAEAPRRPEPEPQRGPESQPGREESAASQQAGPQGSDERQQGTSSTPERSGAPSAQEQSEDRRQAARSSWGDAAQSWGQAAGAAPSAASAHDAPGAPGADPEQPEPAADSAHQQGAAASGGLDVEEVRGHWSAILDQLHEIRRAAHALVSQNAQVVDVQGTTIVLGFRSDGLVNAFRRGPMAQNVADAARRVLRTDVTVEAVVGDGPAPGAGGAGGQPGSGGGGAGGAGGSRGPAGTGGAGSRAPSAPGASDQDSPSRGGARWGDQIPADHRGAGSAPQSDEQSRAQSPDRGARPAQRQVSQGDGGAAAGALGLAERMERNAARARGSRPQAAGQDEYAPEPDDPYGEPYDNGPPPGEDFYSATPQRPADRDAGPAGGVSLVAKPSDDAPPKGQETVDAAADRVTTSDDTSSEDPALTRGDGAPLEVEDEGRDTLPAGEPRTFGQAALRRALAEGRVVHSRPATNPGGGRDDQDDHGSGGSANDDETGAQTALAGAPTSPSQGSPYATTAASEASAPSPSADAASERSGGIPGWDRPMERPGQGGRASEEGPDAQAGAPSAPSAAPAQPARRSGADLVREAAHASMAAHRKRGNQRGPAQPEPPVDDDPTGGASRDDEDAEYTTRTGREVIEAVLGGRVLEVIDETGR